MNYIFKLVYKLVYNRINLTIYVDNANKIPPHNESIKTVNIDQFLNKAKLVVSNTE